MKLVIAIIKPSRLEEVRQALNSLDVHGMTVTEVKRLWPPEGTFRNLPRHRICGALPAKPAVEIAVERAQADAIVTAIRESAQTGRIGDGKIFVLDLLAVHIRIRTGETGAAAPDAASFRRHRTMTKLKTPPPGNRGARRAGPGAAGLRAGRAPAAEAAVEAVEEVAAIDTGDTAWMFVSTIIVILMTIPGLALFYGGLVRGKNVLSVLTQVFAGFALIALLWVAYGYSLAFGGPTEGGLSAYIGDLSRFFLAGVTPDSISGTLPELVFVCFQLTFACITSTLIVGGIAERMKFGAVLVFLAIWFTFSYLPIAHMVWSGGGLFFNMGALDFAGGTVVHINSGVAALVAAVVLGSRKEFLKEPIPPHNLTFTFIGACLLGSWFSSNRLGARRQHPRRRPSSHLTARRRRPNWGSAKMTAAPAPRPELCAGGPRRLTPAWLPARWGDRPAPWRASLLWAVVRQSMLKYDDSLDVFGIHGIGGIVAPSAPASSGPGLGGLGAADTTWAANWSQVLAVVAIVWSGVVARVAMLIVRWRCSAVPASPGGRERRADHEPRRARLQLGASSGKWSRFSGRRRDHKLPAARRLLSCRARIAALGCPLPAADRGVQFTHLLARRRGFHSQTA